MTPIPEMLACLMLLLAGAYLLREQVRIAGETRRDRLLAASKATDGRHG